MRWTTEDLVRAIACARERTLESYADLPDEAMLGPRLSILNPPLWEIGHVAWFQEKWVLRRAAGLAPWRPDVDALYDSAAIPHGVRWDLPLPSREETHRYLRATRDRAIELVEGREPGAALRYFVLLSIFHEDMHGEAFTYTRQTLGYPPPPLAPAPAPPPAAGPLPGDASAPGGRFDLGAREGEEEFVFDNEKWAHPRDVRPFAIARAPVTQGEFAAFVEEGGYAREDLWSAEGRRWLSEAGAEHPVYWRPAGPGAWERRRFDRWVPLEPDRPAIHVSWFEADAWCRWAGRRLPTELEWEVAATGEPAHGGGTLAPRKRRFPWGEGPPGAGRANLDGGALDTVDVGACGDGDGAFGCRQMIGNVWEWTASDFLPYPGFVPDPYREYSAPWFGTHRVLRGGSWATRGRLLRGTWRNFYTPDRRDVWAGFRTCAIEPCKS